MIVRTFIRRHPPLFNAAIAVLAFCRGLSGLLDKRRGAAEHLKSSSSLALRSPTVLGKPVNITIEPVNVCNLRCPVCETGTRELGRPDQFLALADFRTIIDKVYLHTNTLMFYFMGEPFLNKDAYSMIAYAKAKGIPFVTTCTNAELVDPQALIESGIDEVNVQIGGLTQETHAAYRVGGNLDKAMAVLRKLVDLKRLHRSPLRIICGFIIMKHNEHEKEPFIQLMSEIGVDGFNIIDPCVRTVEQGQVFLPEDRRHWIYDEQAFGKGILRPKVVPHNHCPWLYYSLTITASGDVVPCCRDPHGQFVMGNILSQSLEDIWNSEKYRKFRQAILTSQTDIELCRLCSSYGVSTLA